MNFYSGIFNFSNLLNTKTGLASFAATPIGVWLTFIYGTSANVVCMAAMALLVALDWITGSVAAAKDKTLSSAYGLQGIARTFVILLLPTLGALIDHIFGLPNLFFFIFWGGIFSHTLVSFAANSQRAGWDRWIPDWALKAVSSEIEAKIQRSKDRLPSPGAPVDETQNKDVI